MDSRKVQGAVSRNFDSAPIVNNTWAGYAKIARERGPAAAFEAWREKGGSLSFSHFLLQIARATQERFPQ